MHRVFVLGNGESRKNVDLEALRQYGKIYGCNAIYRDFTPDALVCVDAGIMHEVYSSGYALENKCYFRTWSKLPEFIYPTMIESQFFDGWDNGFLVENEKGNRKEFVFNGTDPNQLARLYEHIIQERPDADKSDIKLKLGSHGQWVTWVDGEDKINLIPEEYGGWSAGPIAVRIALEEENPDEVYLIGFDLGSSTELINNIYKGTTNYNPSDAKVTPSVNWINQHKQNFEAFPDVKFFKVNSAPLGTDATCQFVEEWKEYQLFQYIEQENFKLSLDFGWMM
jgi:hypothetical protein